MAWITDKAMKTYKDDEIKSWHWCKRQEYIPSSDSIGDGSIVGWKLVEKYPIERIIYNQDDYPNPINHRQVVEMVEEFYPFGFHPIRINKDQVLVDGQHRLKFDKLCCLKFIDVFV
jgi:hypothetical protein